MESSSRPTLNSADKDEGPLGPSAVSRLPHLAVTSDEAAQLGYMPNRDDFERVINNERIRICYDFLQVEYSYLNIYKEKSY